MKRLGVAQAAGRRRRDERLWGTKTHSVDDLYRSTRGLCACLLSLHLQRQYTRTRSSESTN